MRNAGAEIATSMRARALAERFARVRSATEDLARPLSPEDCVLQSMPDASPTKWHLAHTSWFFEAMVLGPRGEAPFDPAFGFLFNSYYEAIGPRHSRPRRGLLSRPSLDEVLRYRADVDRRVMALLDRGADDALLAIVELGVQHEQQHQELILTDIKHALFASPLRPAYQSGPPRSPRTTHDRGERRWIDHGEGVFSIGHAGGGFAFDNETPRHRVFVSSFSLADRLVTNGEVMEFIADGGYARPEHWLSDGWAAAQAERWDAPLYWSELDGGYSLFALDGVRGIDPNEPACHLSFYEADAIARWAGARLPTEAEWELFAATAAIRGNFVESGALHPKPAPEADELTDEPAASTTKRTAIAPSSAGPSQLFGDTWEWTASAYLPYPGFRPWEGAVGEYNGKFMSGQMVLRGGSCVTPQSHVRASYRNFFPPGARWQFSGLRLARDA